MSRRFRYITIAQENEELFNAHPVYRIRNNKNEAQIGVLSWWKPWREYMFSSTAKCMFNSTCLKDVLEFLEDLNR